MERALALASFIMEIGPCSPTAKIAAVTRRGASISACHSSSVNADLSVIGTPPPSLQRRALVGQRGIPLPAALGREVEEVPHRAEQVDATLAPIGRHLRALGVAVAD